MKLTATVVEGVQIGTKFGIATANLAFAEKPALEDGVYLVEVQILGRTPPKLPLKGAELKGLLHFGARKTFGGDFSAEVHILDFEADIYGQQIQLELGPKLREVKAFRNADALFTQIETDILHARKYFARQQVWAHWKTLSLNDQQQLASTALKHLSAKASFLEAQTVFVYAPQLGREIGFVAKLMAEFPDKQYLFPKVDGETMDFCPVEQYADLAPGFSGILEPQKTIHHLPSTMNHSLMLVPSVAVTAEGDRLGQGGGFYDRYLAGHKVKTLAVVPSFAVLDELPTEKHDQRLGGVVVCDL